MKTTEKNTAFATLDIGTSQIKLGVYCSQLSDKIILINSLQNELQYGTAGEVRSEYSSIKEKSFRLLKELGIFLKKKYINTLYLGICGHVSSLLEWNRIKNTAPEKPFPIWLDTTSHQGLGEYDQLMGNGKSREIIGTFLPAGTNWLLTKLLDRKRSGFSGDSIFLQVSDAIFFELSGKYQTHFSSQISMVNLRKREYASELLNHLQLDKDALPYIDTELQPILDLQKRTMELPADSFVFPAMADLYTSLYGLRLEDKQGFMLANTSEQAGAFYELSPGARKNFLSISFDKGYVNYGSTNTGGNVVNWYISNILNLDNRIETLQQLTVRAVGIEPRDTPVIMPYLQGERAPLWNSQLTASIHELKSAHTDAHLFRAILESIAFARRQCFEELGIDDLDLIKIGGGSSHNDLWNVIRATVLKKPVAVASEKELSLAGIIDYMIEYLQFDVCKPLNNFKTIYPQSGWVIDYDEKYDRFLKYQKMIS